MEERESTATHTARVPIAPGHASSRPSRIPAQRDPMMLRQLIQRPVRTLTPMLLAALAACLVSPPPANAQSGFTDMERDAYLGRRFGRFMDSFMTELDRQGGHYLDQSGGRHPDQYGGRYPDQSGGRYPDQYGGRYSDAPPPRYSPYDAPRSDYYGDRGSDPWQERELRYYRRLYNEYDPWGSGYGLNALTNNPGNWGGYGPGRWNGWGDRGGFLPNWWDSWGWGRGNAPFGDNWGWGVPGGYRDYAPPAFNDYGGWGRGGGW